MTKITAESCECQELRAFGSPKWLTVRFVADSDFTEFVSAIRKGGKMGPQAISEKELRTLFDAIDDDKSGDVSSKQTRLPSLFFVSLMCIAFCECSGTILICNVLLGS